MTLSPSKKYLAVCEKAQKAICSVYNIQAFMVPSRDKKALVYDSNNKKKRVLIAAELDASEYVSVSISGLNEKLLVTLTSGL
jgi:hypothetical protein